LIGIGVRNSLKVVGAVVSNILNPKAPFTYDYLMKRLFIVGLFFALLFWAVYLLGYYQGLRKEQRAWTATSRWTQSREPDGRSRIQIVYQNPHVGLIRAATSGKPSVNTVDAAVLKRYRPSSQ